MIRIEHTHFGGHYPISFLEHYQYTRLSLIQIIEANKIPEKNGMPFSTPFLYISESINTARNPVPY